MANNNADIELLAALDESSSEAEILKAIKKINRRLKYNANAIIKLYSKLDIQEIQKQLNRLDTLLKSRNSGIDIKGNINNKDITSSINNALKQAQAMADKNKVKFDATFDIKKSKLLADIQYFAQQNSKMMKDANMVSKYNALLDNAKLATSNKEIRSLRMQLSAMRSELKANNMAGLTLGDTLKKTFKRAMELFSGTGFVMLLSQQLRRAWQEAMNLDKSFTSLVKVQSALTRSDYPDYLEQCNKKAKELATTQQAIIDGATEFSKSGYDLTTSNKLSEQSAILSNVGEMQAEDSAKAIIAGVQAYDIVDGYDDVIKKAQALIDKYNEIGNTASITTAEIAQGIQTVGSVFSDANTSVDEFIAMLAAGNRSYQDADAMALALRTAALRIRGCTVELEQMGEETDGVYTSASKLQEKIEDLTNIDGKGGVQILNGDEFRSIYDIFVDLSKVYKDMSDVDQSALLELIAGKHRANAISSVLNNGAEMVEVYQRSLESAGSAQKEYEKYLESSQASLEKFRANMIETYQQVFNGETTKAILNAGSSVLEFANSLGLVESTLKGFVAIGFVKTFTTLSTAFKATALQASNLGKALQFASNVPTGNLSKRFSMLKNIAIASNSLNDAQLKLVLSNKALSNEDRIRVMRLMGMEKSIAQAKLAEMGLTQATNAQSVAQRTATINTFSLSAAVKGLGMNLRLAFMSNPVGISIMALSTAIGVVTSKISEHNQAVREARQADIDNASAIREKTNELNNLYIKYKNLSGVTNRTSQQEEEFKQVVIDITKALGDKAEVLANLSQNTSEYARTLREATKAELEGQYATAKVGAKAAENALRDKAYSWWDGSQITIAMDEQMTAIEEHVAALEAVKDILAEYEDMGANGIEWEPVGWDENTKDMNAVLEYYYSLIEARDKLATSENADFLMSSDIYKDINTTVNNLKGSVEDYTKQQYEALKLNYEWQVGIPTTKEELDAMKESILKTSGAGEHFQEVLTGLLLNDFSSLATEIQETEEALSGTTNKEYLFDKLTKSKESIDKFKSSVESAYESYGKLMNPNLSSSDILTNIQAITNAVGDMGESLNWEFIYSQTDSMQLLGDVIERFSQKYAESVLSGAGIDVDSKFGQMLANNIIQAQKASIELENLNDNIDSLQSAYNDLTDIVDTYNSTGSVTFDQLQTLLSLEPQYLACLIDESGQLAINEQAMIALANQRLNDSECQAIQQAISELGTLTLQDEKVAVEENATAFSNAVGDLASYNAELSNTIAEASVGAAVIRDLNAAISSAESGGASDDQIQTVLDNLNVKLQAINSVRDKIASGGLGGAIGGSKSGGGGSSKDAWKEAYDKELKELEHLHEMQLISDEEYYNQRIALNEKYFGEASGKHEKYLDEYQKNEEDIAQGLKKMWEDYWNDYKDGLDRLSSYAEKVFQKQIDALEKQKDKSDDAYNKEIESIESAIKALEDKRDAEKEYWQNQIDAIQDEIDALQDANDERERAINLQQKMYNLQRAMSQRSILQYSSEKGMHYVTNDKDITNAREEVEQAKFDITIANLQKQKEALEDKLDEITNKYDVQIEKLNLRKETIENNMDAENKRLQEQIDLLEEQKEKWTEVAENIEFALLEREMMEKYGSDVTQKILSGDVEFLNAFISDYERATGVIQELDEATLTDIMNMVSQFGTSAENMGGISTQLADNLGTISGSADNLAESASKVDMTKVNDGLSNVSSTAQTAQEQLGTATQKFNELTNEINNYTIPPLDSTNFVASLGIDGNGGVLGDLQTFINKFKELCESIPTIWNDSLSILVNGGGEAGGAEVRGYDSLFKPLLDAMTTTKTAIDTKLEEYKLAWQKFNTDLGTIIGVGNGSQTGAESTDASGGKQAGGKESSDKKEKKSEADTSSIVGTITAGGEAVIQSFDEIWIPGFETFRDNISTICEQVVQCMDEMAKKAIEAAIKTIEAVNAASEATGGSSYDIPDSLKDWEGVTYVRPYAEGTEKAKKGLAIVAEEKPEIIVDNDGNVLLAKEPSIMNMEGGETVYNGETTAKMINGMNIVPLTAENDPKMYDMIQKFNNYVGNAVAERSTPVIKRPDYVLGDETDDMKALRLNNQIMQEILQPISNVNRNVEMMASNISKINNSNRQIVNTIQSLNVTCPGITSDDVAKQISGALYKELGVMDLQARQRASITR